VCPLSFKRNVNIYGVLLLTAAAIFTFLFICYSTGRGMKIVGAISIVYGAVAPYKYGSVQHSNGDIPPWRCVPYPKPNEFADATLHKRYFQSS